MTLKSRIAQLEKAGRVNASALTWKNFIQCDNPAELPPDLREKWGVMMEQHTRGMSTLAEALESMTGQPITADQAEAYLRNINHDH